MVLIIPTTRAKGRLRLVYTNTGLPHKCGANLVASADIENLTTMRATAQGFAAALKQMLPNTASIIAWEVLIPSGEIGYTENFVAAIAGTHGVPTGNPAYNSRTITITGKGIGTTVATAHGQIRVPVFVGSAYAFTVGEKWLPASADAGLAAVQSFFHTNVVMFADFYGQHGEPNPLSPVQFNAHYQSKYGT